MSKVKEAYDLLFGTPHNSKDFNTMREILEKAYGKDHFEIEEQKFISFSEFSEKCKSRGLDETHDQYIWRSHLPRIVVSSQYVTIHFDEIIMTNRRGDRSKFRDMYARVSFDRQCRFTSSPGSHHLEVMCLSPTYEQKMQGIAHSHGGSYFGYFGGVCTGSGPINHCFSALRQGFNPNAFKAFLAALKAYLEWENIDEGPRYDNVRVMSHRGYTEVDHYLSPKYKSSKEILPLIRRITNLSSLIKYQISNGRICVEPTEALETVLGKLVPAGLQCLKSDGKYYNNKDPRPQATNSYSGFQFNGKIVALKIVDSMEKERERGLVAHPEITRVFCELLGEKLTNYAIFKKKYEKRTPLQKA